MASGMTALDEAVKRFIAEDLEREGIVTGWVLLATSSTLEGPLAEPNWTVDYTTGPDTDMVRAVGMVEIGRTMLREDTGPQ